MDVSDFGPISLSFIAITFIMVILFIVGAWGGVFVMFVFLTGWAVGMLAALCERHDRW